MARPRPRTPTARLAVALAVAGCGPSAGPSSDAVPTCDEDGPVRLIEGVEVGTPAFAIDGRLIVTTFGLLDEPEEVADSLQTWSAEPCGDSPAIPLLAGSDRVFTVADTLIGCTTEEVLRLAPEGDAPPTLLFPTSTCQVGSTPLGLIAYDAASERLLVRPPPYDEPAEATTLVEGIGGHHVHTPCMGAAWDCNTSREETQPWGFYLADDAVLFVDAEHRLSRLELSTREVTVIREGVAEFHVFATNDRILVRDYTPDTNGTATPSAISVVDLAAGEELPVDEGRSLRLSSTRWPYLEGAISLFEPARLIDLRTGESYDPPLQSFYSVQRALPGDRVLLRDFEDDRTTYAVWTQATASTDVIATLPCSIATVSDDALTFVAKDSCEDETGVLLRKALDGAPPEELAEGIGDAWRLRGNTIVTSTGDLFEAAPEFSGDLIVVDRASGTRHRLDTQALYLDGIAPWTPPDQGIGDDVLYYVNDGDRSGLWRTALR